MVHEEERPKPSSKSQPRMWKCGQEYQYPIPKPDGNPWEVVLESLLKKDQVQCAAWKDEVQNLLIFAGLFSAVVTSFVVQSYQALKPGSNDLAVLLLARIASQLESKNSTNLINLDQDIPSTTSLLFLSSASPSDLRVNTFWFLSLVLSLTTVLVGIVSLQWLRAHQHYNDSLSPRLALGIYHMRAQALERWYVPQVFATLPLLLQVALVLFFAGLIDFLLQLAPSVAVPVTVAVGATVVFLVVTTVLPSLQCLFVSLRQPQSNDPVPSPCPYKSPQSLAFKRLITLSRRAFCAIHELSIFSLYLLKFTLPQSLSRLLRRGGIKYLGDTWKYRLFSHRAYLFWASPHWIEFDRTWLILRNEHFDITRVHADGTGPSPTSFADPIYDSIRALGMATKSNEHHEGVIFAAYHCFQDVSLAAKDEGGYPNDHLQACYRDLVPTWNSPIANIASMVVDPSAELAHDIHTVLFLRIPGIFYKAINPAHVFGKHMLELHTRILGTLFAHGPCGLSEGIQPGPTGFFHWYTINLASLHFDPDMQDAFYEQFFIIFDSFIRTVISLKDTRVILNTFHTHADLDDFISLAAYLTWRTTQKALERNNTNDTSLTLLVPTLEAITKALTDAQAGQPSPISDYLFCCAALFLKRVWQERPTTAPKVDGSPLHGRLAKLLQELQCVVLPQHESRLDQGTFFRLYGKFVPWRSLPSQFLKGGRDFVEWYSRSGHEPTVVKGLEEKAILDDDASISLVLDRVTIGDAASTQSSPSSNEIHDRAFFSRSDEVATVYPSTADDLV